MYQDKTLTCKDCGSDFVFSASEQEFYAEKGFSNEPGRCADCRSARKAQTRGGSNRSTQREMHAATCSECGSQTQVPFRPSGDRPIYCSDCFSRRNRY